MRYRVLSDTRKDGRKVGIAYEELPITCSRKST
jgi:hypothetical protein